MAKDEENMVGSLVAIGQASKNLLKAQTVEVSLYRCAAVKISNVNGNRVDIQDPVIIKAADKATARTIFMRENASKLPEDDESGRWLLSVKRIDLGTTGVGSEG